MFLVGVNYASHEILKEYLRKWSAVEAITHIVIVDCFSTKEELVRVKRMCAETDRCTLIALDNVGYGTALNIGLEKVISLTDKGSQFDQDVIVLFGNIDVLPLQVSAQSLSHSEVPLLNIYERGKQRNPFLTAFQAHFLWVAKLASKHKSRILLNIWKAIYRFTKYIPSKGIYAVHGAMFGLRVSQLKLCTPIFDSRVFLYCEELFFARAIHRSGLKLAVSNIDVEHIGSVSTSQTIKKDRQIFFENWCISSNKFFGIDENKS